MVKTILAYDKLNYLGNIQFSKLSVRITQFIGFESAMRIYYLQNLLCISNNLQPLTSILEPTPSDF